MRFHYTTNLFNCNFPLLSQESVELRVLCFEWEFVAPQLCIQAPITPHFCNSIQRIPTPRQHRILCFYALFRLKRMTEIQKKWRKKMIIFLRRGVCFFSFQRRVSKLVFVFCLKSVFARKYLTRWIQWKCVLFFIQSHQNLPRNQRQHVSAVPNPVEHGQVFRE